MSEHPVIHMKQLSRLLSAIPSVTHISPSDTFNIGIQLQTQRR